MQMTTYRSSRRFLLSFCVAWLALGYALPPLAIAASVAAPKKVKSPAPQPDSKLASKTVAKKDRFGQGIGIGYIRVPGNRLQSSLGASESVGASSGIEWYGELRFSSALLLGLRAQQISYSFGIPGASSTRPNEVKYTSWLTGTYIGYNWVASRKFELPLVLEFNYLFSGSLETVVNGVSTGLTTTGAIGGSASLRMRFFLLYDLLGFEGYGGYRYLKPSYEGLSISGIQFGFMLCSRF